MNAEDARYYRDLLGTTTTDEYYQAKFINGEVKIGWSNSAWLKERTAAWVKRPSKGCHTMLSN